jgi:hypothetical protein
LFAVLGRKMLFNIFVQIIALNTILVWASQQINLSSSGVLKGLSTKQNTKLK